MKWRVAAGCLLAFVAAGKSREKALAQTGGDIYSQPEPAVVSIFACDTKGKATDHATGFFVSTDGKFVSTRHAIAGAAKAIVQMNDGRLLNIAGVIVEDPLHDLVLLQVAGNGFPCLKLSVFDQARKDSKVAMIVDPYTSRKEAATRAASSQPAGRIINGTIVSVNNLADDYQWLSIHMPVRRGESGSPVLNEAGGVIGMVRAQMGNNGTTCFAVSVDYIGRLLATPAPLVLKPVAQLQKREYNELFDDLDFKAGILLSNSGDYPAAMRRMELAVKRFPGSGAFHVLLGNCYARQSMWNEADREFGRAIAIKPDNAMAWASLAMTFVNQDKLTEAADACQKAAALKSDSPDTWFNVAGIYVALKRYDEARAMLHRLQDFKTSEADEMAEKLTRALEIANAEPPAKDF